MPGSRKTYAALLIAVFVFGGLLGPALHFVSHAVGAEHHTDVAPWHDGPHATNAQADASACDLCDFRIMAASVEDVADGATLRLVAPTLKAPAAPPLASFNLTLSRAPPAHG
ncbi:MAG: hypothetical protein GVY12_15265 [Bacteroidetes bacterium]|jgi:hypothetical protein|nr:hypothetical protein [Bacteroidota bacterium]